MNLENSYSLTIFRVCAGLSITSFIGLLAMIWYVDPFRENWYIWPVYSLVFVFLCSLFSVGCFAWYKITKHEIIFKQTINQFLLTSSAAASFAVLLLFLVHTSNVNIISVGLMTAGIAGYGIFRWKR
jgi:nicotinamide riboside transporter PnuC